MLAELTYRCPLACPYCSNPLQMGGRETEMSDRRMEGHFLTGGGAWRAACPYVGRRTGLAARPARTGRALRQAWPLHQSHHLRRRPHQGVVRGTRRRRPRPRAISIQDAEAKGADWIGGYEGGFAKKLEVAAWVTEEGLPLTVNAVIHRANVARAADMVDFAVTSWRAADRNRPYSILRLGAA